MKKYVVCYGFDCRDEKHNICIGKECHSSHQRCVSAETHLDAHEKAKKMKDFDFSIFVEKLKGRKDDSGDEIKSFGCSYFCIEEE